MIKPFHITTSLDEVFDENPCEAKAIQVTMDGRGPQYLCRTKLHHLSGSLLPSFLPFSFFLSLFSSLWSVVRPSVSVMGN